MLELIFHAADTDLDDVGLTILEGITTDRYTTKGVNLLCIVYDNVFGNIVNSIRRGKS